MATATATMTCFSKLEASTVLRHHLHGLLYNLDGKCSCGL